MDSQPSLPQTLPTPQTEPNFVNGVVNGGGSDSDNDGFVSGEEESEPTRPVLVYPDSKPTVDEPLDSEDDSTRPIAKVTADDDEDDDSDEGSVTADDVVLERGGGVEKGELTEEVAKEEGDFSDSHEVFVEADDKGFESSGDFEAEALKEEEESSEILQGEEDKDEAETGTRTDISGSVVVEDEPESGVVEDEFTSGGDSLVDTLQVDLLGSGGVAVVGDEEVQVEEIKGVEVDATPASGASLDSSFEPIEHGSEGVIDGVVAEPEPVEIVDRGVVGVDDGAGHEQESDIAPLETDESLEVASESLKAEAEQDGINIEGHDAVEGETGSHVVDDVEGETGSNVDHVIEGEAVSHVEASGEGDEEVDHLDDKEIEVDQEVDRIVDKEIEGDEEVDHRGDKEVDGLVSDKSDEGMIFGGSDAANKYLEELEQQLRARESSQDETIDGQIVTDSEEEGETDDDGDGKELFDTATLAALLKAASGAGQEGGGGITITSQDGSRLFSVERPAGLGPSLPSVPGKPTTRSNRPNLFSSSISRAGTNADSNLSEDEKKKLEKLQQIRIKFLRLVQRLGFTPEESIAAQVLYRLTLVAGRQTGEMFSLDAAKQSASQLEAAGRDDFEFSINILVLGKTGVGKSATINSIFGETKTSFSAYGPATNSVKEIVGMVDGVKIRVFDTPGLMSSAIEQGYNRKVLSMIKKFTKKSPPDIVLYVDRLDLQTRDLNDLPLLRSISSALGPSIWRNVIVTLTHAASAPPDGPSGSPLSYDVFVAQRSHIVQQTIGQAVGDLRLMNPSLMNPVSLVENHPSCRKNRDGQKILPNGQSWRPLLLLLCYSMKILSEAGNISKTHDTFDHRRLFGFRTRSPPLPYLLSWLLQSRAHPKLAADQGGVDNGDSDVEMADLSDSDADEGEDEYDQLPPFKPLKKSQIARLNRDQQKAYFEEYDYRVKLLQKKQWREELRRMSEMKKRGKTDVNDYGNMEEDDPENGSPAAVPVPLPDMVLPQSFDSDNPAYRYRFLEPTSQLLARPVLDSHSWDHDCGYDGVNIENSLAIINRFPAAVTVQVTKDKKDFSIHLDSSVAAKHGENGSTMAGFDIQNIGKQLAYIVRGETKFKNFKRNKTGAGFSVTFLGENVSTGLKVEDQIAVGKRLVLVGSTGTVRSQGDSAYGANVEVRLREADFPIGQDQSSLSLSLVKWRGDLALGANVQSQFSLGRGYKMAVRAGLNNKLSGQISVRTSSSDQLQIALIAILPIAKAIYKNFWPGAPENYSIY